MPGESKSAARSIASTAQAASIPAVQGDESAVEMALEHFRTYAREKPEVVVLWALGIGFVLGWKLRFW